MTRIQEGGKDRPQAPGWKQRGGKTRPQVTLFGRILWLEASDSWKRQKNDNKIREITPGIGGPLQPPPDQQAAAQPL